MTLSLVCIACGAKTRVKGLKVPAGWRVLEEGEVCPKHTVTAELRVEDKPE